MVKPKVVTALADYKLHLEYSDGVQGEVDLSHLVGKGVFSAWDNLAIFEAVSIGPHGQIRWSDDLELCAHALYLELAGKNADELFPNLRAHADA